MTTVIHFRNNSLESGRDTEEHDLPCLPRIGDDFFIEDTHYKVRDMDHNLTKGRYFATITLEAI